jgi:hypothetical protein
MLEHKSDLDLLCRSIRRHLEYELVNVKFTTQQRLIAEALNYKCHNDLLYSLPVSYDCDSFVKRYVELANKSLSDKLSTIRLWLLVNVIAECGLSKKKVDVSFLSGNLKETRPFFESMGVHEFEQPFPVLIFLDHRDNSLYVSKTQKQYSPETVAFGIEQTFKISANCDKSEINTFLADNAHLFEQLLNNSWIEWNSTNFVCSKTEKGYDLEEEIRTKVENHLMY